MNSTDKFFTTTGAVAGVPLALLINRYLLGNKSSKSKWIAGAIGAGAGAATGMGVSTYMAGKAYSNPETYTELDQLASSANYGDSLKPRLDKLLQDRSIDFTTPEGRAKVEELFAPVGGMSPEARAYVVSMLADRDMEDLNFDINKHGVDNPLFIPTNEQLIALNNFATRHLTAFGARPGTREYQNLQSFGGINPAEYGSDKTPAELFTILHHGFSDGSGNLIPRQQLAAMMVYHNNLKNIYTSGYFNDDNEISPELRIPEVVDYLALRAMPASLRTQLPVAHRLTSIARARASNGWSYSIDRQMIFDPEYRQRAIDIYTVQDNLFDLAGSVAAMATLGSPGANAAIGTLWYPVVSQVKGTGFRSENTPYLPRWTSEMDSESGDSFWFGVRNNRNKAVRLLTGDQEAAQSATGQPWVPMYPWLLPSANRSAQDRAFSALFADGVWSGVDALQFVNAPGAKSRLWEAIQSSFGAYNAGHSMTQLALRVPDGDNSLSSPGTIATPERVADWNARMLDYLVRLKTPESFGPVHPASWQLRQAILEGAYRPILRKYEQAWGN